MTLTQLAQACAELAASRPAHQTSALRAVASQLRWFAGPPVRNTASLGGNVATASPISDLNPLWVAAGASFLLAAAGGGRRAVPAHAFFLGYRRTAMEPGEVLLGVRLPWTRPHEYVKEFKQARGGGLLGAVLGRAARFYLHAVGGVERRARGCGRGSAGTLWRQDPGSPWHPPAGRRPALPLASTFRV